MKTHYLKTDIAVFADLRSGKKTAEIRLNDRDYRIGDKLVLFEYDKAGGSFTGHGEHRTISHVLTGYGLKEGWCCLSFETPRQSTQPEELPPEDISLLLECWRFGVSIGHGGPSPQMLRLIEQGYVRTTPGHMGYDERTLAVVTTKGLAVVDAVRSRWGCRPQPGQAASGPSASFIPGDTQPRQDGVIPSHWDEWALARAKSLTDRLPPAESLGIHGQRLAMLQCSLTDAMKFVHPLN